MSFKENLLRKIRINSLTSEVIASIGPPDSEKKADKQSMKALLEMSSYKYRRERDIDLYISEKAVKHKILVSDNDLAIYNSSPQDVGLRKSPTVKEMLNVFNMIKILNDSDVVVSKKEASVRIIQNDCMSLLDLSFNEADIGNIAVDGMASFESNYAEGVMEAISLFAELLGYVPAPKAFQIIDYHIVGSMQKKETGQILFGPLVMYNRIHNIIKRIERQLDSADRKDIEFLQNITAGKEKASQEGTDVFTAMRESVKIKEIKR